MRDTTDRWDFRPRGDVTRAMGDIGASVEADKQTQEDSVGVGGRGILRARAKPRSTLTKSPHYRPGLGQEVAEGHW